jgi:hypothetical protein
MAGSASLGAIPQHRGGLLFKASSACQGLGAKLILAFLPQRDLSDAKLSFFADKSGAYF